MQELALTHRLCNQIATGVAEGMTFEQIAEHLEQIPGAGWIEHKLAQYPDFKAQIELVEKLVARSAAHTNPYQHAIGLKIAEHVARKESLAEIADLPGYPTVETMRSWIAEDPEFSRIIWDARLDAAQQMADEMCSIADDKTLDPASRRVMVDTRKWVASKLLSRYSDKIVHSGDQANPLAVVLSELSGKTLGPPSKR